MPKTTFIVSHQSTTKTAAWNLFWVLLFLGSLSAVTTLRHGLRHNERFSSKTRTLATEVIHMASLTRGLLVP